MASTAYRTSTDLVTEALANLGVLAAGQAVDAEDFNYVNEKLDAIFRKIAALEIVTIADPNNIPGAFFSDLADIVAGECCTKFGVTPDDYALLINKGLGGVNGIDVGSGAAAKSLRAIVRLRPTFERLQPEFF
ncbi:MAG TPA: hypothetical protein VFV12_08775 [Xanthobacteraceae bacterium]|nr:hypothetical protein [Xanthobacteraceae bacterium]